VSGIEIAKVVADLRDGRIHRPPGVDDKVFKLAADIAATPQPVVDVTALYTERTTTLMDRDWAPYDEHPSIAPPWNQALFTYLNKHGNVVVASMHAWEPDRTSTPWWDTQNNSEIDWEAQRWRIVVMYWMGGKTQNSIPVVTAGPVWMTDLAVGELGEPADIHWVHLWQGTTVEEMQVPTFVVLDALNFLNCRNVDIVEPRRRNHERKRIAKTGITVNEIHVFPTGKTTRNSSTGEPLGTAHAPVRGHFAEYGDRYGKGKLFGKLEGRFYISPHIRGSKDVGESVQEFTLHTED
jgi:hypothetical protein